MGKRTVSVEEMVATTRWRLAIDKWLRINDPRPLDELRRTEEPPPLAAHWLSLIDAGELRRPRGRPPVSEYAPEVIVQLVCKAKLQAGLANTNARGADNNPCFYTVADHLGRNVREVRRDYAKVAPARRREIERQLRQLLDEFDALHPHHRK